MVSFPWLPSCTPTQLDHALQHAMHRNFHEIIVLLLDPFDMPWAFGGWSGPVVCMCPHSLSEFQEVRHRLSLGCAPTSSLIRSLHPWKAWKYQPLFISLSPQWLCLFQFTISQNRSWPFYAPAIPYSPPRFPV